MNLIELVIALGVGSLLFMGVLRFLFGVVW
jgi:Tfp pilus assembly protein PilW